MSVILAKRALPKSLGGAPPPEVAAALAQLPNSFGQLGLASGEASLNIKAPGVSPASTGFESGTGAPCSCVQAKTSSSQLFVGMTRGRDRVTLLSGGAPAAAVANAGWARTFASN